MGDTEVPDRQLDLLTPLVAPPKRRGTIDERFAEFHASNPQVYRNLVALAHRAFAAGRDRLGMKQLWEVLRWEYALGTTGDTYKLNNDYTALYARLLAANEPELAHVFETRARKPRRAA